MFGEGQQVGPELTGSQRTNLEYVLENVLDPSAVVPREFQMVNFNLTDDRVVSGIVLRETKDAVTVRTVNDTLTIPTADIAARKQTPVSIMPEGLFDRMKPDEVRDLVAYLREGTAEIVGQASGLSAVKQNDRPEACPTTRPSCSATSSSHSPSRSP